MVSKKNDLNSLERAPKPKAKLGTPIFPESQLAGFLMFKLDPTSGQLKELPHTELHHQKIKNDIKFSNQELTVLLIGAQEQLRRLHESLSRKGIKFSVTEQKHFDDVQLLLERAINEIGPSKELSKEFFNKIICFFKDQCDHFSKPFLNLGKKRQPIEEVLNQQINDHHYTRALGSILRNFIQDSNHHTMIKNELDIDLKKNLAPYNLDGLKININPK